jgi:hypothetical protein
MKRVFRISKKNKVKAIDLSTLQAPEDLDAKSALIPTLIPLGLQAVAEALKQEVAAQAGEPYCRSEGFPRVVSGRASNGPGGPLEEHRPETTSGGLCPVRHRTQAAPDEGIPPYSHPVGCPAGTDPQAEPSEGRSSCVRLRRASPITFQQGRISSLLEGPAAGKLSALLP